VYGDAANSIGFSLGPVELESRRFHFRDGTVLNNELGNLPVKNDSEARSTECR